MKVDLECNVEVTRRDIDRALQSARLAGGLSSFYISQPSDLVEVMGFTRLISQQIEDECPHVAARGGVYTVRVGLETQCDEWHLAVQSVPCVILVCAEVLYGYVTCPDEECTFDWESWNYFAPRCKVYHSRATGVHDWEVITARIYLCKRSRSVAHTLGGTPYGSR